MCRAKLKGKDMKLEVALLAGAESKAFLAELTTQIDRLEKLAGKGSVSTDIAPRKRKTAAQEEESFDLDSEETESADEGEEVDAFGIDEVDEDEAPKVKLVSVEDVQKALHAYVKKHKDPQAGKQKAIALLKKVSKTGSVPKLTPDERGKLMKLLGT